MLTETGVVTAGDLGYGTVEVKFEGKSAIAVIIVVSKGTYRLLGTISESGVGLHDVTVTVLSGIGEPLTTRTVDGFYAFYGVAGEVQLKATRDGYVDKIEQITVTSHRSHSFEMTPSRPRIDLSGTYTLTVTTEDTGPSCPTCSCSALPQEVRRRVYTATLEQTAADLKVSLSGADFVLDRQGGGNTFRGIAAASGEIIFWLRPASIWDYDGPEVVERLSDGTAICVAGTINARSTPTGISGTVDNSFGGTIYRCSGPVYTIHAGCWIDRFDLVRR